MNELSSSISLAYISSSTLGVSNIMGIPQNLGSCMTSLKPSSPIFPSPMFSWRSRWQPSSPLESLRCTAFKYFMPTTLSNSSIIFLNPCSVARSCPAAKAWQVSKQTPILDLSCTLSIMPWSSTNFPPI